MREFTPSRRTGTLNPNSANSEAKSRELAIPVDQAFYFGKRPVNDIHSIQLFQGVPWEKLPC